MPADLNIDWDDEGRRRLWQEAVISPDCRSGAHDLCPGDVIEQTHEDHFIDHGECECSCHKFEFSLFCERGRRVVLRQTMTQDDADEFSERLAASGCGHLVWRRSSELKVRKFVVKR